MSRIMAGGVAVIVFIAIVLADGVASEEGKQKHCVLWWFFLFGPDLVLVVGGSGFVGYHTTLELANKGFSPVVLDNFNDKNADPGYWSWRMKRSEELHKKGYLIFMYWEWKHVKAHLVLTRCRLQVSHHMTTCQKMRIAVLSLPFCHPFVLHLRLWCDVTWLHPPSILNQP